MPRGGRNDKNLRMLLHDSIESKKAIGQKKVDNPEGLRSIKTIETYRRTADEFAKYCKQENIRIKDLSEIKQEHIQSFFDSRKEFSSYTLSRELSALNKILDRHDTKETYNIPDRSLSDIRNNRGLSNCDRSHRESQKPIMDFVRATGIRRETISRITPNDAIRDARGLVIGFNINYEKGGRCRNSPVLLSEREKITAFVNSHEPNKPFFPHGADKNSNPHWYRGIYAKESYMQLVEANKNGIDYYQGYKDLFIDRESQERAMAPYVNNNIKGYQLQEVAECSQMMGHNRALVIVDHYLNK